MLRETKVYSPSFFVLLFLIGISLCFSSCAPLAYSQPPKQPSRCVVLIGATWCVPCNQVERDVLPQLRAAGLKVGAYTDKASYDVHTIKIDRDFDPRPGWKIEQDTVPCAVVFEGGQIVERRCGVLSAEDFYRLLNRNDLFTSPVDPPAELIRPDDVVPTADSSKSLWDQLTELLGCDTSTFSLCVPQGRKIILSDANAAVVLPDTLAGHIKMVGEAVQIDFDKPLIQVEATRLGIRLGTTIPSVTLTRNPTTATFRTGLGIPYRWRLESDPFAASAAPAAETTE